MAMIGSSALQGPQERNLGQSASLEQAIGRSGSGPGGGAATGSSTLSRTMTTSFFVHSITSLATRTLKDWFSHARTCNVIELSLASNVPSVRQRGSVGQATSIT